MPSDLKTFRRLTLDKPIVMGRKTFESIGKPLDRRANIVVTRDTSFVAPMGVHVAGDLDSALALGRSLAAASGGCEVMVIGGGEIYAQSLAQSDRIYLTRILADVEGDASFPSLDPAIWHEVARSPIPQGPGDEFAAELLTFERAP